MKLTFLGTAAAEGLPAPWCECEVCKHATENGGDDIRRRCAYLLDDDTLIDYGPDILEQVRTFHVNLHKVKRILITHSHFDHLSPMEFLWRLSPNFCQVTRAIKVFGSPESLARILETVARDCNILSLDQLKIEPQALNAGTPANDDNLEILPLAADHQPGQHAMIYFLSRAGKSILIANDTGFLPEQSWEMLKGRHADFVSIDCTCGIKYSDLQHGHMGCATVVRFRDKLLELGVITPQTKVYANHFSHNGGGTHADLKEYFAPHGISVASDGLSVEI